MAKKKNKKEQATLVVARVTGRYVEGRLEDMVYDGYKDMEFLFWVKSHVATMRESGGFVDTAKDRGFSFQLSEDGRIVASLEAVKVEPAHLTALVKLPALDFYVVSGDGIERIRMTTKLCNTSEKDEFATEMAIYENGELTGFCRTPKSTGLRQYAELGTLYRRRLSRVADPARDVKE